MTLESALAFAAAMTVLAATPGPGVFATVSQALAAGFRASLFMIAGIVTGDILFLLLAVFGLSVVASVLGDLFYLVKVGGGVYLIWLGWKAWRADPASIDQRGGGRHHSRRQQFMAGLLITLGNPKVIVFYIGFLPTFMDLTALDAVGVFLVSGIVLLVLTTVMGFYAYWAARARRLFTSRKAVRVLNRSAGTVMVGTGVVIATR